MQCTVTGRFKTSTVNIMRLSFTADFFDGIYYEHLNILRTKRNKPVTLNQHGSLETNKLLQLKKKGLTLITSPPPGSGSITAAILAIMDQFNPSPLDLHRSLTWHRSDTCTGHSSSLHTVQYTILRLKYSRMVQSKPTVPS
jgi:hypothetical protein